MSMGWGPAAGIAAGGFGWDDGVATQVDHGVQVGWPHVKDVACCSECLPAQVTVKVLQLEQC